MIDGTDGNVSEAVTGTKGNWNSQGYRIRGDEPWAFTRAGRGSSETDPYQKEHDVLQTCIRQGRHINNLRYVAESTLTAIMGRMSAYTGRAVTWEQALNSQLDTMPKELAFGPLPVPPVIAMVMRLAVTRQ